MKEAVCPRELGDGDTYCQSPPPSLDRVGLSQEGLERAELLDVESPPVRI